jgi:hypothetical protein
MPAFYSFPLFAIFATWVFPAQKELMESKNPGRLLMIYGKSVLWSHAGRGHCAKEEARSCNLPAGCQGAGG